MKRRFIAAAVMVFIVGGGAWFLLTRMSSDDEASSVEDLQDEPNVRIGNVELLEYGDDGSVLYKAVASAMEHSQHSDTVTLNNIDVQVALEAGSNWSLAASAAIIRNATSQSETEERARIDLIGDVHVMNEADRKPILSLVGRDLTYYPNERMLESQHPVTIQNESATFNANSFEFDLKSNEFHLIGSKTNRVEIEYAPSTVQ